MESKRILIVDDIYTNRILLKELVRSSGHEVVMAENGKQAIEILERENIDLVFMDIEMPVMNGIETTNYIRSELAFPLNAIPIIALTAHNPDLFFEDYVNVGFDELITKPYSVEKIRKKMNSLI